MDILLKAILDNDEAPIVACDDKHIIRYMNKEAAKRYAKSGGYELSGKSIFDCHNERSREMISKVAEYLKEHADIDKIFTFHNEEENKDVYMVALRDEEGRFIGYYEKHCFRNRETGNRYEGIR